ncbi:MAG: beta-lactamase family protein, partial [Actinomycetota bacterium]|nr:beta-lactamase family protein [Actinomycetota bacterium]
MPDDAGPDAQPLDSTSLGATWEGAQIAVAVVEADGDLATFGDGHQPFRLASVTKLLTAYACLVATEEGTLDLDEAAGPPGSTVRHLLAHAAGYDFDIGLLASPGRRRIYSNAGFDVLGDHLARQVDMTAADYVVAAVVEPLGLTGTDFRDVSVAHGAWSTAADLGRFGAELLAPTLIHPDTLAEATSVQFPGLNGVLPGIGPQSPNDWGLGFELRDHKDPHWTGRGNSPSTFGHFGASGTFCWVDPDIARC